MWEKGKNTGENVLALDSDAAELERLRAFIDAFCERERVPEETCYQLQVALEELVLNAIKYGECEPKERAIRLAIKREGDEVCGVLSDSGIRFNPLEAPPPDLTGSVSDRPLGGLGIHLVRHFLPSIRYERREGRNHLYFTKPVNPDSGMASQQGGTNADGNGDNQSRSG
jgi:anti-sigma regulatory factor (Ser/Thr protein kinase)